MTSAVNISGIVGDEAHDDSLPPAATWTDTVEYKAGLVLQEILDTDAWLRTTRASERQREAVLGPYKAILRELHSRELPYARLLDRSDLVVHLLGPAASVETPSVSVVARVLATWQQTINRLARALAQSLHLAVPAEVFVGFAGLVPGSIIVGFSAPRPTDLGMLPSVVENDAQFKAVREALSLLSTCTSSINAANDVSASRIAEVVDRSTATPQLRDLALTSIHQLSPSVQSGFSSVELSGTNLVPSNLTPRIRQGVLEAIKSTASRATTVGTLKGTVREIDLDEHRFELRHTDKSDASVRCSYSRNVPDERARAWLDQRVEVQGAIEYDKNQAPSMIWSAEVEITDA